MHRDLSIDFAPSLGREWELLEWIVEGECCASPLRFDQRPLATTSFSTVSLAVGICNLIKSRERETHKVGDFILRGFEMNG